GTLDPFASGVLPLFLGAATRVVEFHLADDKAYRATICFGATSTTDDLDGDLAPVDGPPPDRDAVEAALAAFTGEQLQRPPAFSAIQVGGRRAYALARAGQQVELAPRRVVIHELALREWDASDPARPIAIVDVRCSAGTYVRALARDLGVRFGSGAYLGALTRTASGPFTLESAHALEAIREAAAAMGPEGVRELLLPVDAGLEGMPAVTLTAGEISDAGQGRFVRPVAGVRDIPEGVPVRLLDEHGEIVGLGRRKGLRIAPTKVFRR
ncbi:MAG TPA: tRNA pseudouridine(55) synthase TruB, partial [Candidatus Binatia bacterium]|nr:tRNA pseudouridine(55) synthase TruB [Candidatus Binatia bacterium]